MQVIEISEPLDLQKIPNEDVVLAMGFFDGVHRGHQAVIQCAKEIAARRHLKLAIMTFDRFPENLLSRHRSANGQVRNAVKAALEVI